MSSPRSESQKSSPHLEGQSEAHVAADSPRLRWAQNARLLGQSPDPIRPLAASRWTSLAVPDHAGDQIGGTAHPESQKSSPHLGWQSVGQLAASSRRLASHLPLLLHGVRPAALWHGRTQQQAALGMRGRQCRGGVGCVRKEVSLMGQPGGGEPHGTAWLWQITVRLSLLAVVVVVIPQAAAVVVQAIVTSRTRLLRGHKHQVRTCGGDLGGSARSPGPAVQTQGDG